MTRATALATVLVFLVCAAPAAAVSGSSGSGSAAAAQYPSLAPAGTQSTGGGGGGGNPTTPSSQTDPSNDQGEGDVGDAPTQAAPDENSVAGRQDGGGGGSDPAQVADVSAGDSRLPFTGFAALIVLLAGVTLLAGGTVVRTRLRAPTRA